MIFSTVNTSFQPDKPIEFRGRKISFWVSHRFKDFTFQEIADITVKDNFVFLFPSDKFIDAGPDFFLELAQELKNLPANDNAVYTISGHPFYIVSEEFLKNEGIQMFSQPEKVNSIKQLNMNIPFHVWSVQPHFQQIESIIKRWQTEYLHESGVVLEDFHNFYMEGIIPVGEGSKISTNVVLKGDSTIGKNVTIYPQAYIENSVIQDNCSILPGCVIRDSVLEENIQIGPYAHLRNGTLLKRDSKVGNFVEVKKSVLGEGSKAMHLTYLGDAEIGQNVNIGAGTITCNYDGRNKNKTTIENGVFIGSGTELIAPIVVGENSYVGAGSTLNQDVPAESLAVARQKQRNIRGWGKRKKKR